MAVKPARDLKQESPAVADKPARRESMPKIAPIRRQLLPSKIAKSREIRIKFDLIAVQGHPRSSILMSHILCDFLLVINSNVGPPISYTVFEILMLKARKWLDFPTPPLFEALLECRDEILHQKTRIVGLPDGEEITIGIVSSF